MKWLFYLLLLVLIIWSLAVSAAEVPIPHKPGRVFDIVQQGRYDRGLENSNELGLAQIGRKKITVVPAHAGIHSEVIRSNTAWIPACAGTTNLYSVPKSHEL